MSELLYGPDGDYVDDGQGGFVETDTAQPACRHQVLDIFGAWVGDETSGRRQQLARANTEREAEIEADSLRDCLEVLAVDGLIDDIEVTFQRDRAGRVAFYVACRDTNSGAPLSLGPLQSLGV